MKKQLRYFQQDACVALHKAMHEGKKPYASLFTGLGKSLVLAALTNRYINQNARVLQLVPRLELVEQNYNEAVEYCDHPEAIGIVCGQMGLKEKHKQVVIAMASSFVNMRASAGKFEYILCDEAHRVRFQDKEKGIYQKIIEALQYHNPNLKVCGVTATPYRLDQGELHQESWKTKPFFTDKVYDTAQDPGLKRLIEEGYLSHIETLNSTIRVDLTGVKKSGDDYNQTEAGVKFDAIIDDAVEDMRQHFSDNNIKTAVIFASSIANAKHILNFWGDPQTMLIVSGDSTKKERSDALDWLKNGAGCRYIVNVNLLTEGFDYKALECVVLLRATTSPGLLIQMVGRVIRPHDDKQHGYLIDYGTNIERLTQGGIENIIVPVVNPKQEKAPTKECIATNDGIYCGEQNNLSAKRCKKCGAEFISESEDGKYSMRTKAEALRAKQEETFTYDVHSVSFVEAFNKEGIPMIKVSFYGENFEHIHNDYFCLNHSGSVKGLAIAKVQSLLKNKKDFYQISRFEGGACVKSVLFLLNNHYQQFFNEIKSIKLKNGSGNFKNLVEWGF
jgi:DNA repair protein RadD